MIMSEINMTDENKVYVACLACYNDGRLSGAAMNADELDIAWEHDWCDDNDQRVLCDNNDHEEWAIHDYDGDIQRLSIGEHPDIPHLIDTMQGLETHEASSYVPAYLMAEELLCKPPSSDEVESLMESWSIVDDVSDWAYEMCVGCGYFEEPDGWSPISYIDWDRVGKDMLMMDYYTFNYGHCIYAIHNGESI